MWYSYTRGYYSALKTKGSPATVSTCRKLKCKRQLKTEKVKYVWAQLYVESKKAEFIEIMQNGSCQELAIQGCKVSVMWQIMSRHPLYNSVSIVHTDLCS